jgi:hypothetical protein
MFIGHQGVAFAAKAVAPRVSLGWLVLATMWLDLVWPIFLLTGVETVKIEPGITRVSPFNFISYPYSHSLMFAALWGIGFGGLYFLFRRDRRGAIVLALVVVIHWVLDWIVHRADLQLYPGGTRYGLDLWDSWPATLAVEFATLGAGIFIYCRTTHAAGRVGRYALVALTLFLAAMYGVSLVTTPPDDPHALAWGSFSVLLLPLWAWWIDRHRATE